MASGFAVRSPSLKATVGEVGVTTKSTRSKPARKTYTIFVRTRCAVP